MRRPRFLEHISEQRQERDRAKPNFLMTQEKHFLQIVYSQNFVFEEKKKKDYSCLVWIFSLLPHPLHCGIFIYEVHPCFWC